MLSNLHLALFSVPHFALLLLSLSSSALAAPQSCLGFTQDTTSDWRETNRSSCPPHYAVFAAEPGSTAGGGAENVFLRLSCCPLPSEDILTDVKTSSSSVCPEEYVVTAIQQPEPRAAEVRLQCTQINTARYRLGEPTEGLSWGSSSSTWKEKHRISKRDVPASLRHALGRLNKFEWRVEGCVGYPFGSLLVGKESKRCHGLSFRELQYRGAKGDPPSGRPVQTLPNCSRLSSKYNPDARCIHETH